MRRLSADIPRSLATASTDPAVFTLATLNMLLPNDAEGGWWVYKFYPPSVPSPRRAWPHRHALLRALLLETLDADIFCIQEVVESTFTENFAFLTEREYEAQLHRKFRLRMATFWRRERFEQLTARHGDRTLTTVLRDRHTGRRLHLVNVHLTGGARASDRRLRQTHQALEDVRKNLRALKLPCDADALKREAVVVCGDFNCQPAAAAQQLLRDGVFGPDDREPDAPDRALTSKPKRHDFIPLVNAMTAAFGDPTPTTLLVPELYSLLRDPSTGAPRPAFSDAVRAVFQRFSSDARGMSRDDIDAWITTVNRAPGRGSEYRLACERLERRGADALTLRDLEEIYALEMAGGKPWSLVHDAACCGFEIPRDAPALYEESLDHVYFTPGPLRLLAAREPFSDAQREAILEAGGLPCAWYPSDHGPVGVALRFEEEA